MSTSQGRIPLPRVPLAAKASGFPVLAFVAPIGMAALMWAFTRSPFVLVFAILGPVIALATMGDSRRRARADTRLQWGRYEREFEAALAAIDVAHDQERAALEREVSHPDQLVASAVRDSERWRNSAGEPLFIRLGIGRVPSSVVVDDDPIAAREAQAGGDGERSARGQLSRSTEELRGRASVLDNAPVVIDARLGIGVCGSRAEAASLATSIAVQLATALSPLDVDVEAAADERGAFQWTQSLPHYSVNPDAEWTRSSENHRDGSTTQLSFRPREGSAPVILCVAENENSLPRDCRVVINVAGSRARIVRHPDIRFTEDFVPDFISQRQAQRFAETLKRAARSSFAQWSNSLPEFVALRDVLEVELRDHSSKLSDSGQDARDRRNSLAATVGIGAWGSVVVDLVAEGPHAIVGGTTGSGKSEVLVTWVLALAAAYRPIDVSFLLIDFKGGAAFAQVKNLPHTVGVLTDLDLLAARRAIRSLQAELTRRERLLALAGARSIADLTHGPVMSRLVIVVDEFAAMASSFPEMHDLFADLAARGRSLGIHLILCTQRPAGSMRDAILANCTLRVSLRVNNTADSVAVVGTPEAVRISKRFPGRGLLLRSGTDIESVQWAVAGDEDASEIAKLAGDPASLVERPWLDPLPEILDRASIPDVPSPSIVFGLSDIPEEQRQEPASYDPVAHGNLFIIGGHRSGKSTMLAVLKASAGTVVTVPSHAEGAWDTVTNVLAAVREGTGPALMLLDDLDDVSGRFSQEHESALMERIMALAREGPRAGTAIVITASALRGRIHTVSALCASTLVLRMRDRQEHVLVGGDAAEFSAQLPPGGGFWRGHRVQVCFSEPLPPSQAAQPPALESSLDGSLVVVSPRPAALCRRLEKIGRVTTLDAFTAQQHDPTKLTTLSIDRGSQPTIIVGDPDSWLSSSALFGAVRGRSPVAFHDCSLIEFRSLARIRELPLPLNSPHDTVVVLHPDGRMSRAKLPT